MKSIKPYFVIEDQIDGNEILKKLEKAGRVCYKSESLITDESAKGFVKGIINSGHESVLEHEKITVRVICDRGVTHEIVRHRIASYSQESTRYCNYTNNEKFNEGISFIDISDGIELDSKMSKLDFDTKNKIINVWLDAMNASEKYYNEMIELGATPQIARGVLPNSVKTEIVITFNIREWRHFFKLRTAPTAHPQMREIAIPLLNEFKKLVPVIFDNI